VTKAHLKILGLLGVVILVFVGLRVLDITYPWQKLTDRDAFISIEAATSQEVWGRTKNNEIYHWNSNCNRDPECNKWVRVERVPDDLHSFPEREPIRGASCKELNEDAPVLSGVIECVETRISGAEFGSIVFYALREDGSILKWGETYSFHATVIGTILLCMVIPVILGIRNLRSKLRQ
jgi:hypothetical protein